MISILLATCGRPELLREMLKSLRNTTQGYDLELIAVVDDDNESQEILTLYEADVIDYSPKRRGALWAWNRALHLSDGAILIPAGDDQLFYPNWLDYALESHQNRLDGYGVVGMNDLAYDGNLQLATMLLTDKKFCKEVMGGVIAPPVYHYYCVDSEWNAKAKALGKFWWESKSIIEHLHSSHGKRPLDKFDVEKIDNNWAEIDNRTFEERKAQGFPITWEPVI
jgi:glycosyltransferase involved in cell wall biosynthesis